MPPAILRRRLCFLAVIGLLAGLMAAAPAGASIVIGQSIAGAKLGASKAAVKQVLGPPSRSDASDFFYPSSRGLRIHFTKGKLDGVLSSSNKQKTAQGITIGSSHAQVKRAYPQAGCLEGPYGPESLYCAVTSRFNGRKSYTSFLFATATGGVEQIELGYGNGLVQELHKA